MYAEQVAQAESDGTIMGGSSPTGGGEAALLTEVTHPYIASLALQLLSLADRWQRRIPPELGLALGLGLLLEG